MLGGVALAAIVGIVVLVMRILVPKGHTKWSDDDTCPSQKICPSHKGDWLKPQCCLPTEKCYQADALCCEERWYEKGKPGAGTGSCCPKDQRTTSGFCCPLGQVASGDACMMPCPRAPYLCDVSNECVEIDYNTPSQGTSLETTLGSELSYLDTDAMQAFACLPRPQPCEQQFNPELMPATIDNVVLGYNAGNYTFTDADLCSPAGECVLDELTKNGMKSLAEVEKDFRDINQMLPENVGQWCGSPSETFLVRSVPGMQQCGWKKCVEQLSYEGLQHVRYNTQTGGCAGIFTPYVKGISLKGSWLKGDSPCQFSAQGCDDGDSFCQQCLEGPGLSDFECLSGGEVTHDTTTVNNYYCPGSYGGSCQPCHESGPNPAPARIECSSTGKTTYPTEGACNLAETSCRGTCSWDGADGNSAPWWSLCSQGIACSCSCDDFQSIWKSNDQTQRDSILGGGGHCAEGTIPCPVPGGSGACQCRNDFAFEYCHLEDASGCGCTCMTQEECEAAV